MFLFFFVCDTQIKMLRKYIEEKDVEIKKRKRKKLLPYQSFEKCFPHDITC